MVVHNLRSWISRAKLDVDQVCVFLDARMVEVYLLEQLLAMHARLPHRAHVSAVEGSDADFGEPLLIADPALGVEADYNHVVC